MNWVAHDLRYALRALRNSPAFTAVALLSLGLGIGANTAIFSLIDQLLLRPAPVARPQELAYFQREGGAFGRVEGPNVFSHPMYRDISAHGGAFSGLAGYYGAVMSVGVRGQSEQVQGQLVTGNYFQVLGVTAYRGRVFTPEDDRTPGAHPVAVLSHGYWKRRFGSSGSAIGQNIVVNGKPMKVIGVLPPGFFGLRRVERADVFAPAMMKAQITPTWSGLDDRRTMWLSLIGRLRPGVSLGQAETAVNTMLRPVLQAEYDAIPRKSDRLTRWWFRQRVLLVSGARGEDNGERAITKNTFRTILITLQAMVGLLLLIACANLANLLLARSAAREKEIAVRVALGAGRGRIVRQLVVECVLLALGGGVLAVFFSWWTAGMLLHFTLDSTALSADPDGRMLLFTFALALLTGLLFGLVPAFQASRADVSGNLKSQSNGSSGTGAHTRWRKGLVVAQVTLSLVLLIGAGLMARTLLNLRGSDFGFRGEQLLSFTVFPALNGYSEERAIRYFDDLQARIEGLPGVTSASMAQVPILTDNVEQSTFTVEGYKAGEREDMNPDLNWVGDGYFSTLGVKLIAGREFDARDTRQAPKVAVINETMANYFFKGANPIGRRIGRGRDGLDTEIVGVVKDSAYRTVREKPPRVVYRPFRQNVETNTQTFYVRGARDMASLTAAVREEAKRLDANIALYDVKTMRAQIDEALVAERAMALLSSSFAVLATLLAALGLYGVIAFTVTRRTREVGIRMALGAGRGRVLAMVMREVCLLCLIGVAIAIPIALALGREVESQLFGLASNDAATLIAATVVIVGAALGAGALPAWRAARIDPIRALRFE